MAHCDRGSYNCNKERFSFSEHLSLFLDLQVFLYHLLCIIEYTIVNLWT